MGRRCKNQAWDGRRNTVTVVEPAHPALPRSIESALILSRLLIVALGVLWTVLLLIVGGAFGGVDAAASPSPSTVRRHHGVPGLFAAAQNVGMAPSRGGSEVDAPDSPSNKEALAAPTGGGWVGEKPGASSQKRMSMLEESVELHQRGQFQDAAEAHMRLLEIIPDDPDGLHLLGLALYSQGKLLQQMGTPETDDDSKALFEQAEKSVRSAIQFAASKGSGLSMRSNLGEVLRAKGDLENAEVVLRAALEEQKDAGIRDHQTTFNLAVTLVEIVRQRESWPDRLLDSENRLDNHSMDRCDDWRMRSEAEDLLKRELFSRPSDRRTVLELVTLFKSNWDLDLNFLGETENKCHGRGGRYFDGERGDASHDGRGPNVEDVYDVDITENQGRRGSWGEQALFLLDRALLLDPSDKDMALERAVVLHRLERTEEARERYTEILAMEGAHKSAARNFARSNLAAIRQENGDVSGAIEEYREVLAESPENPIVLNNLGAALLTLGRHEEGVAMLEMSMNAGAMANLGAHWQEEGDLDRARSLYTRAERLSRNDGLPVRRAIMLPPIMAGEREIVQERRELIRAVDELIARDPPLVIPDPPGGVERVHFYLVYRGGNHREVQEKIARMYMRASPGLLHVHPDLYLQKNGSFGTGPHRSVDSAEEVTPPQGASSTNEVAVKALPRGRMSADSSTEDSSDASADSLPLRVGFASKFFGEEEPHGMLLDGVIRHLPRKYFRVFVCPINSPGKWLSPRLSDAADEVVQLPSKLRAARQLLGGLRLDILVYADMNSEPTSHFLGYSRLARVQAVFWGNPITTGNPSIDYFVSAEVMERQDRTAIAGKDEPYSEQVVLLGGQGIWYDQPTAQQLPAGLGDPQTREATKAALRRELKFTLGLEEDSVIFMCPQSLFKLKPDFDLVLRDIMLAFDDSSSNSNNSTNKASNRNSVKAYLVLTEGRRKLWTEAFLRRLRGSVPEIIPQVKMLPRTSAGKEFHTLLASADVILHPFPFGGSKTSVDGLALAVPVVAMKGDALPGRMAFSLYSTMGLAGPADRECCVARDKDSYVELAVRLGRDVRYREWASDLISGRSWSLWERKEVVVEWARFLSRAAGRPAPLADEIGLTPGADTPLVPPQPFEQTISKPHRQERYNPGHIIQQHQQNHKAQDFPRPVEADDLRERPLPGMGGRQALPKRRSGENVQIVPRSVSAIEDASRTTLAECTDDGAGYLGSGAEVDGIGKDGSSSGTHDREGTTTKRLEDQSGGSEAVSATQRADMTTLADRSLADSAPGSFKIAIATHRNLAATVDNARTVASLVDKSDSGSTSTANSNNHNNEGIGIGQFDGELRRISSLTEAFTKLYAESRLQEAAATLQEVLRIMQGRRARKINVKASNGNSDDGNNTLTTKRHFTQGGKDVPIRESHDSPGAAKDKEVLVEDRQMDTRGSGDRDGGRSGLESDSTADGVEPPLKSGVEEVEVEEETLAIARVMNDLGCTLQQLWRLDEAESMLRGAIANHPGYSSAMAALGVTLQAKNQLDEAEVWYREALRQSPLQTRDDALANLVLLMKADGNRLGEAIDTIVSETSIPPLHQEGSVVAVLSLLQPRPMHRQAFRRVEQREGWRSDRFGGAVGWLWEETNRLRELYPLSINNLVVFLGLSGGLEGVFDILADVAGIEPLLPPRDEEALLPKEVYAFSRYYHDSGDPPETKSEGKSGTGRNTYGVESDTGGIGKAIEWSHRDQQQQPQHHLPHDKHSVHVVTQYYVPQDLRRAREIDACLLHNLLNPFVGTVHILSDHPDAAAAALQNESIPLGSDSGYTDVGPDRYHRSSRTSGDDLSWRGTSWRPPVLRGIGATIAGKARVVTLLNNRRMTFRDALRYSNRVLKDQVVLLSNSDITFDESLARLGDPYTLNMAGKVFALAAWQSKLGWAFSDQGLSIQEHSETINTIVVEEAVFAPRTDSQDAWIFRPPLPTTVVDATDFEMGRPRCDGRLAQILLDAGYSVTNPSLSLVAHHVHASERSPAVRYVPTPSGDPSTSPSARTYRGDTQVPGATAAVLLSDQWLF